MQKVYAHRGASGYAPENTLEAFALAAEQHAHGVELDAHLTRDGEIVVIHDETIDRTSTGSGAVRDMTLAELRAHQYNAGMPGFSCAIPTLRDVYALLAPTGLSVNVELKTDAVPYEGIERKCVALAAEMGMTRRVLYSSFNHYSLLNIKAIDPALPCGLLYGATMVDPWKYAAELGMDALHPYYPQLFIPGIAEAAHEKNILVNPWTVNEEDMLRRMFAAGADIVITNYPDRALAVVASL